MRVNRRWIVAAPLIFLSIFLCWNPSYAKEKPEIIRLDAHYTENVAKISVHWQSANPVALIHAVIGSETKEIRVDPYDNRRNPDGYEGESVVTFNISASHGATGIPYVVQIEDDLRQKSEQVTGRVNTGVAGGGASGAGSESWSISDEWSSSGTVPPKNTYQNPGGKQTGGGIYGDIQTTGEAWDNAKQGQPGDLIDIILDKAGGGGSDGGGQDKGGPASASGGEVLLNDSNSLEGFLWLTTGEEVAAYLGNPGSPLTVTGVEFLMGGATNTRNVTLRVLEGAGPPENLIERYSGKIQVAGNDGVPVPVDLAPIGGVPIQTGQLWISLRMEDEGVDGFPGIGVDTSANAFNGRNWLRSGGIWSKFDENETVRGRNAIIRAIVTSGQDMSKETSPDHSPSVTSVQEPSSDEEPKRPVGPVVESSSSQGQTASDPPSTKATRVMPSLNNVSATDRTSRVAPAGTPPRINPIRAGQGSPAVTGFNPTTVTLARGGSNQSVTIFGSCLQNATIEVVKGTSVIRDLKDFTATIQNRTEKGFQVILGAPSSGTSTGRDYALKVLAGGQVVGQMVFSVQATKASVSFKPTAPVLKGPGMMLRR